MKKYLITALLLTLASCGGGPDGTEPSDTDNSHIQIAKLFLKALKFDPDYKVELIKQTTLQPGYIVLYDSDLDSYDAYKISDYTEGENLDTFINSSNHYFDIEHIKGISPDEDIYKDFNTGLTFNKSQMTSSDLVKAQELADKIRLKKAQEKLIVQFSLSPARAKEIAAYALQLDTDMSHMTVYQFNQFSKAILGTTISDIKSVLQSDPSGTSGAMEKIYEKAAAINGTTVDHTKSLADLYIKNI